MVSFNKSTIDIFEALRRFEEMSQLGWKISKDLHQKKFAIIVYVDSRMLYGNDLQLISLCLYSNIVSDFFRSRGENTETVILLSDFDEDSKPLEEMAAISKEDRIFLNRADKLDFLKKKHSSFGFTPNQVEIKFDIELSSYNKLVKTSYYWVNNSGGSIVNDVPCLRSESGRLIPLYQYERTIFRDGINLTWINEFCKSSDYLLILSSEDNIIHDLVKLVQFQYKDLTHVPIPNVKIIVEPADAAIHTNIKSKYFSNSNLHFGLLQNIYSKAVISGKGDAFRINELEELMDSAEERIHSLGFSSWNNETVNNVSPDELEFILLILRFDTVFHEFMNTRDLHEIINFAFSVIKLFDTLIHKPSHVLHQTKDDKLTYLINKAFFEIILGILGVLGFVKEGRNAI